jgi:hypothetical protein
MAVLAQKWLVLYQIALLEPDPTQMATRLLEVQNEIFTRLNELKNLSGPHDTENQAIRDALNNILALHRERRYWAANQGLAD